LLWQSIYSKKVALELFAVDINSLIFYLLLSIVLEEKE
jgi:hypothetical protein